MFLIGWPPAFKLSVGFNRVASFLDFLRWGYDHFAIEDGGDLLLAQGAAFDCERALNGADVAEIAGAA